MGKMTFGQRLKHLRTQRKLSQEELGKKFRKSQSTIAYYERDQKRPTKETIIELAEFFGVRSDYLLGLSEGPVHYTKEDQAFIKETEKGYLDLDDLKKSFKLIVDGKEASEEEIEEAIKYIKIQRMLKKD
jgi:transcriptional regulator with XRE-family HTH domain